MLPAAAWQKENAIRTFLLLLGSLLLSLILGAVVAYIAVELLPCNWFGTAFEGACAYGVFWTSIILGLIVTGLSFATIGFRVLRRRERELSRLEANEGEG